MIVNAKLSATFVLMAQSKTVPLSALEIVTPWRNLNLRKIFEHLKNLVGVIWFVMAWAVRKTAKWSVTLA